LSGAGMRSQTAVRRHRTEAATIKEATNERPRRSNATYWAWLDLNQRPHPHQPSRVQRCVDRRFPRSIASVRGEVMRSKRPRSTRCRQARLADTLPSGNFSLSLPAVAEAWRANGWGPSTTRGERSDPRAAPTPASTPRGRGRGPTPTQTAAAGDPGPDRHGAGSQRRMASSSAAQLTGGLLGASN
jgi:hypothetical protein